MGFSSVTINAVRTGSSLLRIAPYYGTADVNSVQDENLILGLQFRGVGGTRLHTFAIDNLGMSNSMFYAYPKQFGLAEFLDVNSKFVGGWDGAAAPAYGPVEVNVTIGGEVIPFYLYKTDHINLGAAAINEWEVL